jgi:hypothetical protein
MDYLYWRQGVCRATMASSSVVLAYAWCALLCICSLQTVVMGKHISTLCKHLHSSLMLSLVDYWLQ